MKEPQTYLLIVQVHFTLICVRFTVITTLMRQFSKSCNRWQKVHLCGKLVRPTAPLEKDSKTDANGARAFMGNFLCGVETGKRFVNFRLLCKVSNLKTIRKMSTLPPLWKFRLTPMAAFTLSTSFHIWASQAKLTTYEIETKQNVFCFNGATLGRRWKTKG